MTTEYLDEVGAKHIVDCCKELVKESTPDLSGYAPTNHNHNGVYQPVGNYITEETLTAKDLADKPYVDTAIANALTSGEVDLSNYYTKAQTYNKEEIDAKIPTVPSNISAFTNDSNYATETFVTEKIAAIPTPDMSGYYTKSEIDALLANIGKYTVIVTNDGNGTASADVTSAKEGTVVTLTNTPNDGYTFKEWQVVSGNITIADNKFTMPASNVEVKAVFEASAGGTPIATSISGRNELKLGYPRKYSVVDANSTTPDVTGTFTVTATAFDPSLVALAPNGNSVELQVEDENALTESFTLKWTDATGKYAPCSMDITVVDAF